jgi:cysteine synthase A
MRESFLGLIGNTPIIKLERIFKEENFTLFAKLELLNPGGSVKDRTAYAMISNALDQGKIQSDTTIVESSSGNLGIGLAQICAYLGLRFICVVDPKATSMNVSIMKAYGAEVSLVEEPDEKTGDFLVARVARVQALLASIENSYTTNQYANRDNPLAHHQTMHEIVSALDGNIDYLFVGVSTTGTLRGCSEYIRENELDIKVVAVDAAGSVLFDTQKKKRLIPGHGAGRVPELFDASYADESVIVTDLDCVRGCRKLVAKESILAGGSSGGIVSAIERKIPDIEPDSTVVSFICDRGDRYMDTVYSDEWVKKHFGDVEF